MTNYAASDPASPNAGDIWYTNGQVKVALGTDQHNRETAPGVWSTVASTTLARRYAASCGTQSAHLAAGGLGSPGVSNVTDKYDGITWSAANNHLVAIRHFTA